MTIESAGLVSALATFGSVWFGHVAVRWLEFNSPRLWPSRAALVLIGLALVALSLLARSSKVSLASGIAGLILVFDAFELGRQARRVREGRAPANPSNPRHLRLLHSGRAVAVDPFAREPRPPVYRDAAPPPVGKAGTRRGGSP